MKTTMDFKRLITSLLVAVFVLVASFESFAQTYIQAGEVYGVWDKNNSPYLINGDITIPNDSVLIIKPGTEIKFSGYYKFNVKGRLLAVGNSDSLITFCSSDTTGFSNLESEQGAWHGIRFDSTLMTNDSSKLSYCIIRDGKALGEEMDRLGSAVFVNYFNKLTIEHCLISNNYSPGYTRFAGGVIFVTTGSAGYNFYDCNVIIRNNTIRDNWSTALSFYFASPVVIGNFIMSNRGDGVLFLRCMYSTFINNLVYDNRSGVVHKWYNDDIVSVNNTIVFNREDGVSSNGDGVPTIYLYNTIVWGNATQIYENWSLVDCINCLIQEGEYTRRYSNDTSIITEDPMFSQDSLNPFSILPKSPCYNSGTLENLSSVMPSSDIINETRIFDEKIDIGAYECQVRPDAIIDDSDENDFNFYPNPTHSVLRLKSDKYLNSKIRIVDMNGVVVRSFTLNTRTIDVSDLPGGVYILELTGPDFNLKQRFIRE
jgi:hypothetical protein